MLESLVILSDKGTSDKVAFDWLCNSLWHNGNLILASLTSCPLKLAVGWLLRVTRKLYFWWLMYSWLSYKLACNIDVLFYITFQIFCVHGGLSPSISTLDQVSNVEVACTCAFSVFVVYILFTSFRKENTMILNWNAVSKYSLRQQTCQICSKLNLFISSDGKIYNFAHSLSLGWYAMLVFCSTLCNIVYPNWNSSCWTRVYSKARNFFSWGHLQISGTLQY